MFEKIITFFRLTEWNQKTPWMLFRGPIVPNDSCMPYFLVRKHLQEKAFLCDYILINLDKKSLKWAWQNNLNFNIAKLRNHSKIYNKTELPIEQNSYGQTWKSSSVKMKTAQKHSTESKLTSIGLLKIIFWWLAHD